MYKKLCILFNYMYMYSVDSTIPQKNCVQNIEFFKKNNKTMNVKHTN